MTEILLYFDLGSPYAYLAATRIERVLRAPVVFEPVLVGGLFVLRGAGSWSQTPARAANVATVDERARRYGLPPVAWPPGWPNNTLHAMRVAILAKRQGLAREYALEGFRRAFVDGEDLADPAVVAEIAAAAGVGDTAITQDVKDELRDSTAAAYARGVVGVPCVEAGGVVHYGDDRLDALAS